MTVRGTDTTWSIVNGRFVKQCLSSLHKDFVPYVVSMDLQLIEADSGELKKQMDKYKLYVVYYSYFIIQPDMLMSKHATLIFLNKEDQ